MKLESLELSAEAIAGRFRWARSRGHPGYLWPDVPIGAWRTSAAAIAAGAAAVLAGASGTRLEVPPGGAGTRALGVAAFTSGMGPLLGHWLAAGSLATDPETAALLRLHLAEGRRRMARVDRLLEETVGVLAGIGVEPTIVKGAHTAHAYFPEPGTRPVSDIDLLVPPPSLDRVRCALASAGYRLLHERRHTYGSDWATPGASGHLRSLELTHADNPINIDLQTSLDRALLGVRTIRFAGEIVDHRRWWRVGAAARVVRQPFLLAHLLVHIASELPHMSLVRLVELVLVVRRDTAGGELDWRELATLLERADAMRFAYPAVELAEKLAPETFDADFRRRLARAATPAMRRIIGALTPGTMQRLDRRSLAESFMWAATPAEYLGRLCYMLVPSTIATSPRQMAALYLDRLFRVARGRVVMRRRAEPTA